MKYDNRVVLTGSRKFDDPEFAREILSEILGDSTGDIFPWNGTRIQHGGAIGFDTIADEILRPYGWGDRIEIVRPDYKKYAGKTAPLVRNRAMVNWATRATNWKCLIAMLPEHVTDFTYGGTATTIMYALESGLEVHVYRFKEVDNSR